MFLCGERFEECVKMVQAGVYLSQARMVKSADTADLKLSKSQAKHYLNC
jgi:hypothetical protein